MRSLVPKRTIAELCLVLALAAFWSLPRGFAEAPIAVMHADLEKTVFDIDVLAVEMRFDDATEARIGALATGRPYTKARADAVARAAAEADKAAVFVRFRRDVSLERFIDAVDADLTKALNAGMIDEARYRIVVAGMPRWFAPVEERGFEDGDELVYQASPEGLHTVLRDSSRRTLIDHIDRGPEPKRALLAAYFAPGSTFREPLVESVFE
jgi:hypothetical protein